MNPDPAFPIRQPSGPSSRRKVKKRLTIRLDQDIVDYFRRLAVSEGNGNYQTLINRALRDFMIAEKVPIEILIRRILDMAFAKLKIKKAQDEMERMDRLEDLLNGPGDIPSL